MNDPVSISFDLETWREIPLAELQRLEREDFDCWVDLSDENGFEYVPLSVFKKMAEVKEPGLDEPVTLYGKPVVNAETGKPMTNRELRSLA
jgi:hypothetical protein